MLGYDYEIIYKNGKDNVVDNSLSRQYGDNNSLSSLFASHPDWVEESHQEWIQDSSTNQLINSIQMNPKSPPCYS